MALNTATKKKVFQDFGQSSSDTGSTSVQVALLTKQIEELQSHCGTHPKDVSSKRGLLQAVAQRRSLLSYLQKNNESQYRKVLDQLGLRK